MKPKLYSRRAFLGIIISLIFLYIAFKDVVLADIVATVAAINIVFLIVPVFVSGLGLFLKTLRWRYLLEAEKKEKSFNIFSVLMAGYFGNNVLPVRMGELLRVYILEKNYHYGKSYAMATIVLERLFDISVLVCFFVVTLFFAPFPLWVKKGGIVLAAILIIAVIVLYLLMNNKERAIRVLDHLTSRFPEKIAARTRDILENFVLGLRVLKKKNEVLTVVIYSVEIWLIEFVFVFLACPSFNVHLSIFAPVFLTIMINIGMFIPSSPGYIGTYQVMCITALGTFGVEKDIALSMSIALHVLTLSVTTIIGLCCFLRGNSRLKWEGV